MCGIAGIYRNDQSLDSAQLRRMGEVLYHRGPDHAGNYDDGHLGLVHTRLSIIDLAGGDQPFFADNNNLVLIANGEIYNHVELRTMLEAQGHRFSSHSDCETILHAYAQYGDDCLKYLHGMFAFALYDKAQQRLLLARDQLGMKPLFLALRPGGFSFASEIKALLPTLEASPKVDAFALLQYLQNQNSTGCDTIIEGVERILPGEALVLEQGKIAKR